MKFRIIFLLLFIALSYTKTFTIKDNDPILEIKFEDKDILSINNPAKAGANVPTKVITPKSRAVAGNNNLAPESSFTNPILLGT